MPVEIYRVQSEAAEAWVAWDGVSSNAYAYGGCRLMDWRTRNEDVVGMLYSLMQHESGYKNTLINLALEAGAVDDLADRLPAGFRDSRVGGARCVMRPTSPAAARVLGDPTHPDFRATIRQVFEPLGALLNDAAGRVKLTPDFGKYAGVADVLYQHTPHVLGISCDSGGCGGKSSYAATGVTAAYAALESAGLTRGSRVNLIGSAGAMGEVVLAGLLRRGDLDVAVCDLKYDDGSVAPPDGLRAIESIPARFSDEALSDADAIIATTWGGELEKSNHGLLQPGQVLLLAHNLAIPTGVEGIDLMQQVCRPEINVIPGQVLTLGGALTSRLEWFSRSAGIQVFDKPLAHEVVKRVVSYWVLKFAEEGQQNPYEALLQVCDHTLAA